MHSSSRRILATAIFAEVVLILTGLALAATLGWGAYRATGSTMLALSAAGFPIMLAVLELFKIPAGFALVRVGWGMKPLALLMLLGGMVATFETMTMAATTWFSNVTYEVTSLQSQIKNREERIASLGDTGEIEDLRASIEDIQNSINSAGSQDPAIAAAQARVDDLSAEAARLSKIIEDTRQRFADEWQAQTANNTARIQSGDSRVAEQALASQRSLPSMTDYVEGNMARWEVDAGATTLDDLAAARAARAEAITALDAARQEAGGFVADHITALRADQSRQRELLAEAMADQRNAVVLRGELGDEVAELRNLLSLAAGNSVIHNIAAKVYAKPVGDVTEGEANTVTAFVVFGVGFAVASATGLAAMISAALEGRTRSPAHERLGRRVLRQASRIKRQRDEIAALERKVEEAEARARTVRKVIQMVPMDEDLAARATGKTRNEVLYG